ncbi:MAG TPA: hypothetical protein VNV42_09665 [Solirubrobacteraceae bacterium]|jgi:hypothetical protein|nr:hypothetical protein [Solirubrobacteraceae bacterium]
MQAVLPVAFLQAVSPATSLQALFPMVTFIALGVFVLVGVLSMLTRRNLHDQIGQGGIFTGESHSRLPTAPAPILDLPPELDTSEREAEIRQMLTARSDRLVRRGEAPLDIDAELARLDGADSDPTGSAHDAALAEEVRQLVRARNERRARQGLEQLDVEAEVRRTLAELSP